MSTFSLIDFSGGYHTTVPSRMLKPNELIKARNCYWDNGLRVRNGYQALQTFAGEIVGAVRTDISGNYETILAVNETGVGTTFYHGEITFSQISGFTWSESNDVSFAQLGEFLVAANGVGDPIVIQHDNGLGAYTIQSLSSYDKRIRSKTEWYATAFDDSDVYTDITLSLSDDGEATQIYTGVDGAGLIITCDFSFNTVHFSSLSGSPAPTEVLYEYSNGSSWVPITPTEEPDWTTGGASTLKFDFPFDENNIPDWRPWGSSLVPNVNQRYALRITFTGGSSITAGTIQVEMDQYLRLVLSNEKPERVAVYSDRLLLISGNIINFSPVNKIYDWRSDEIEYFQEGGDTILHAEGFPGMLLIFKPRGIYAMTGNSYKNYQKQLVSVEGPRAPQSVVVTGNESYFVGGDGIRGYNGTTNTLLSKTIRDEIPLTENACGCVYQGRVYISFPDSGYGVVFDPDSARRLSNGDATVSFYRFDNWGFSRLIASNPNTDNAELYAVSADRTTFYRLDVGDTDAGAAITMDVQTLYFSISDPGAPKRLGRIKTELAKAGDYTFYVESNDGQQRTDISLASATAPEDICFEEVTLPYDLDGRNVSFGVSHTGAGAAVHAIHIELFKRRY